MSIFINILYIFKLGAVMKKEQMRDEQILPNLKSNEELIGFFQAQYMASYWWFLLVGWLVFFTLRYYYVGTTDKGIHLHKLSFWGKPDNYDFFSWDEIEKLEFKDGFLQAPLKLKFKNGRKLKLKAQLKGVEKIAKLDEKTKVFLLSKIV